MQQLYINNLKLSDPAKPNKFLFRLLIIGLIVSSLIMVALWAYHARGQQTSQTTRTNFIVDINQIQLN